MGRFWIETDNIHEEVDHYAEAWIRALDLRAAGHSSVLVFDKAAKVPLTATVSVVAKKGKK